MKLKQALLTTVLCAPLLALAGTVTTVNLNNTIPANPPPGMPTDLNHVISIAYSSLSCNNAIVSSSQTNGPIKSSAIIEGKAQPIKFCTPIIAKHFNIKAHRIEDYASDNTCSTDQLNSQLNKANAQTATLTVKLFNNKAYCSIS